MNIEEFFWESMQDHGWIPRDGILVSPDDARITVSGNCCMYWCGVDTSYRYTDANYAELLRFERDSEVQTRWCSRSVLLLRFASEVVQLAAVQRDGYAIQHIENPSEAVKLAAVRQNAWLISVISNVFNGLQASGSL